MVVKRGYFVDFKCPFPPPKHLKKIKMDATIEILVKSWSSGMSMNGFDKHQNVFVSLMVVKRAIL